MYCSNCGKTLNANLNYCNSCGTRVEAAKPMIVKSGSPMLSIGGAFIGAIGLMAFFPILRELLRSQAETPTMIIIILAYLLTVFGMFGVLIWQGRRGSSEVLVKGNRTSEGFGGHEAFRGINTAQLPEPTSRPASVTEHTTRTLDEVPFRER
jgi:hypothetical protein